MHWMTVTEVAKYLQVSEMFIYKLSQRGDLPGVKVGRSWRFARDRIDQWMLKRSSGRAYDIPEQINQIIRDLIVAIRFKVGDRLRRVILYGSYARGDATPDSDVDLLVVMDTLNDRWAMHELITQLAYAETFTKGRPIVIAPVVMSEMVYATGGSPLLLNVRKEGKTLL